MRMPIFFHRLFRNHDIWVSWGGHLYAIIAFRWQRVTFYRVTGLYYDSRHWLNTRIA